MLNKTDTNPEIYSRNDFVVGAPDAGYYYPFSHESNDPGSAVDEDWPGRLPAEYKTPDGLYVKPGFDLETEITHLAGPIVEIGGPTRQGFDLLNGVRLPSRPIMTDIVGTKMDERGFESLVAVDKLVLDALLDIRKAPIADDSVGMVIASCLPKTDQHRIRQRGNDRSIPSEQHYSQVMEDISTEYAEAGRYTAEGRIDEYAEATDSPRIAAIIQAARILMPGGLFLARWNSIADAAIAESVGLELMLHTSMERKDGSALQHEPIEEMVFQKPFDLQQAATA